MIFYTDPYKLPNGIKFYPEDKPVPDKRITNEFYIKPLQVKDTLNDYNALMENTIILRQWSQSYWPSDDFSISDNLSDIKNHENDHISKSAFTFTVLSVNTNKCIGCIYVTPFATCFDKVRSSKDLIDSRARISFWMVSSAITNGQDKNLLMTLIDWFNSEWFFAEIYFFTNINNKHQIDLLNRSKLLFIGTREVINPDNNEVQGFALYGIDNSA